ncbi:hypothetical protein [Ancylobacter radicis]|uniref:Uncharacterized protein n=1 Tax=Ancylobacter radicis TaxID=2836179 RepID=A0ABS5RA53_9HYPH|nr:hypothetical protein [Ancylobacter radicis]MBS9478553.1 hypothetical protein [Ancylobacter radicis]
MHQAVDAKVEEAIRDIVLRAMGPVGVRSVSVTPGTDHDGDEVLRVTVHYTDDVRPVNTGVMSALVSDIRSKLWAMGEDRFPHVRHDFPVEPKVVGFR